MILDPQKIKNQTVDSIQLVYYREEQYGPWKVGFLLESYGNVLLDKGGHPVGECWTYEKPVGNLYIPVYSLLMETQAHLDNVWNTRLTHPSEKFLEEPDPTQWVHFSDAELKLMSEYARLGIDSAELSWMVNSRTHHAVLNEPWNYIRTNHLFEHITTKELIMAESPTEEESK